MTTVTSPGVEANARPSLARKTSRSSSMRAASSDWEESWRAENDGEKLSTQGTDGTLSSGAARAERTGVWLGERRQGVRGDGLDLAGRSVELLVGEHGSSLERELAVELDPGAAALVLGQDPHRHRARDAVGAQHDHVHRVPALPGQPLLGVVRGPDVVGRERVDAARIADQVARRHLGPRTDAHPVGLGDAPVLGERLHRRLGVRPHALLQRPPQLGHVRLAHQVVALVIEGRVEEEAVVLDLEVLVLLADPPLAQGQELLAFGQGTHGDGPLFECGWHQRRRTSFAPGQGLPARSGHSYSGATSFQGDFRRLCQTSPATTQRPATYPTSGTRACSTPCAASCPSAIRRRTPSARSGSSPSWRCSWPTSGCSTTAHGCSRLARATSESSSGSRTTSGRWWPPTYTGRATSPGARPATRCSATRRPTPRFPIERTGSRSAGWTRGAWSSPTPASTPCTRSRRWSTSGGPARWTGPRARSRVCCAPAEWPCCAWTCSSAATRSTPPPRTWPPGWCRWAASAATRARATARCWPRASR